MLIILLTILCTVIAASLVINKLTNQRNIAITGTIVLTVIAIFLDQWLRIEKGNLVGALHFFSYLHKALPYMLAILVLIFLWSKLVWQFNQQFKFLEKLSIVTVMSIAILIMTLVICSLQFFEKHEDERIEKAVQMLPEL